MNQRCISDTIKKNHHLTRLLSSYHLKTYDMLKKADMIAKVIIIPFLLCSIQSIVCHVYVFSHHDHVRRAVQSNNMHI